MGVHLHDWLDVSPVHVRGRASVERGIFGSLELALVDVSVLVANCAWEITLWGQLTQSDHVGTQVDERLLVALLDKIAGASSKKA